MKYFVIIFFAGMMSIFSQSYHTINIDGINDFNDVSEKLQTTDLQISAYVTWDKDYIYIGYSGSTNSGLLTEGNRTINIYIDTDPMKDPTQGTGTRYGEAWTNQPMLPFSANYHYSFKTIDNSESKSEFISGNWFPVSFTTENFKGNGYWEVKIKRSEIGNPDQIYFTSYIEEDWQGGYIGGGVPFNLFTPNNIGGFIGFEPHLENYYFLNQIKCNSDFNRDNYQWILRINASAGTLADTTTYAGFALNATDSLDLDVDLPNNNVVGTNFLDTYFPHYAWNSPLSQNYSRDIRHLVDLNNNSAKWRFEVNTDQENMNVILNLDKYPFLPADYSIYIYDTGNDSLHNVKLSGNYSYNSGSGGVKRFDLLIGKITNPPSIRIYPDTLNFGGIALGGSKELPLQIENRGDSTLVVSNIVSDNSAFTIIMNAPLLIQKDSSIVLPVIFHPLEVNNYSGTLSIISNDNRHTPSNIILIGRVLNKVPRIALSAQRLNYGNVFIDMDSTLKVTIYNSGDTTLSISNIISGDNEFRISGELAREILKNDSTQVSIIFRPEIVGTRSTSIHFISNDPIHSDTLISVTGTGVLAPLVKIFNPGWSLFAIPLIPINASVGDIIGDDITSFYAFSYSNSSGYYSIDSLYPGRGYWLGIEDTAYIDIIGNPVTTNYIIPLYPGWNIISDPFIREYGTDNIYFKRGTKKVNADSAAVLGWIQKQFIGSNGSRYIKADTLKRWSGYWLPVLTDSVEMYCYYDSTFEGKIKNKKIKTDSLTNWIVNISASIGNNKDNLLNFGVSTQAVDEFDFINDLAKPPMSPASEGLETYFAKNNWHPQFYKYQNDIKKAFEFPEMGKEWTFRVYSKQGGLLNISWLNILNEVPENIRNNYKFTLSGPSIQGAIDMLSESSYNFQAMGNSEYIFNINSEPTNIKDNVSKTYSFELHQNYPNPFNPSTQIRYTIAKAGKVSLEIFNMLGQRIEILVQEEQNAGINEAKFDASKYGSGIYYYRLTSSGNTQTRKMVLIK